MFIALIVIKFLRKRQNPGINVLYIWCSIVVCDRYIYMHFMFILICACLMTNVCVCIVFDVHVLCKHIFLHRHRAILPISGYILHANMYIYVTYRMLFYLSFAFDTIKANVCSSSVFFSCSINEKASLLNFSVSHFANFPFILIINMLIPLLVWWYLISGSFSVCLYVMVLLSSWFRTLCYVLI